MPLFPCADIPRLPVITNVNYNSSSISLTWTHDKTCFESDPLEYHVQVDADTQAIVTDQLTAEIGGIIFGREYTVSVMAVADGAQRSELDEERVTAGGCRTGSQCLQLMSDSSIVCNRS